MLQPVDRIILRFIRRFIPCTRARAVLRASTRMITVGLVALALSPAGCQDPLTGVTLTIDGDGVVADQLSITADAGDYRVVRTLPATASPTPLMLPVSLTATLSTQARVVTFEVVAYWQGQVVTRASSPPLPLKGGLQPLTVSLSAPPPPPPPDLAWSPPDLAPPPSRCPLAGVLVCDGFESPALTDWTLLQTNGTVASDHTHVYRGAAALLSHELTSPQMATALLGSVRTLPTADIYLRVFAYAPAPLPAGAVTFLRIQHSATPFESLDLQLDGGVFGTRATKTGVILKSTLPVPTNQWICLEWHVQLATAGSTTLLVDGVAAPGLGQIQDTTGTVPYDWLLVGLEDAPAPLAGSSDYQLWLDELAVGPSPIGCGS